MSRSSNLEVRLLVVVLALALLSLLGAGATPLHLRLERSSPAADAEITEAPAEIRLYFSQEAELAVSRVTLEGPDGPVKLSALEAGVEHSLFARIEEDLAAGAYTVSWRTSSGDGHPIRGTFGFTLTAR